MEGGGFAATFYCLLGNFVEIVLVSKNAPRGSHCGGAENVAIATRRRRRMSQATFFIQKKIMQGTGTRIAGERGNYDRDYEKRK